MIFSIFLFLILCLDIIKINKNNILIKEMCAVAINKINLQYLKLNNVYNLHKYLKRYIRILNNKFNFLFNKISLNLKNKSFI